MRGLALSYWVRSSYIWNCLVTERLCVSILFVTLPWSWTVLFRIVVKMKNYWKILSGGSLGSYVDEGRSKMREIVWIAGHIEHRYSERKLQSKARLCSTPVWGSLLNHSNLLIGKYECVSAYVLTRSGGNWLISSRWLVYAQLSRVVCSCDGAHFLTSDQTRVLAEFKHIIKSRKRN